MVVSCADDQNLVVVFMSSFDGLECERTLLWSSHLTLRSDQINVKYNFFSVLLISLQVHLAFDYGTVKANEKTRL